MIYVECSLNTVVVVGVVVTVIVVFVNATYGYRLFTCTHNFYCKSILFSPLGKLAVRAIYFACINFFFFIYFYYFTMSKAISVSTGLIFTTFSANGKIFA